MEFKTTENKWTRICLLNKICLILCKMILFSILSNITCVISFCIIPCLFCYRLKIVLRLQSINKMAGRTFKEWWFMEYDDKKKVRSSILNLWSASVVLKNGIVWFFWEHFEDGTNWEWHILSSRSYDISCSVCYHF